MPVRRAPARRGATAVAVLAVAVSGCQLEAATVLELDRDGSGTAGIELRVDAAMLEELDELGIDPTAELEAAVTATPGWESTRVGGHDGLTVAATTAASDPAALADALRSLGAGLSSDDPTIDVDLELAVEETGAATVAGTAAFRAPAGPGVLDDDPEVAAELAELTAEHVTASVRITLPGPVADHDADEVEGRTLTWEVPVDGEVAVTAASQPPRLPSTEVLVAGGAAAVVVVAGGLAGWWLRRRRRHGA